MLNNNGSQRRIFLTELSWEKNRSADSYNNNILAADFLVSARTGLLFFS